MRDEDTRACKYNRVEERDQRDIRQCLGRRQNSSWDVRGESRRNQESDFYKGKDHQRSGFKTAEEYPPAREEDGSKTMTDLGFRLVHSQGL